VHKYLLFFILSFISSFISAENTIQVSHEEALEIGVKIWYNECGGTVSGLTSWNRGEDFASLGIGHFIWYPADRHHTYSESFQQLLKYMQEQGVVVPYWLQGVGDWEPSNPWNNREKFLTAQNSARMQELRQFLSDTIPIQTQFMVNRMERALPKMLESVPEEERPYIRHQFYSIAREPLGVYVLVDYVNFKGIGVTENETYDIHGWGLLEVLEEMKFAPAYMTTLQSFAWSANRVLTRRVANALPYHDETKWLDGWRNRLKTYLD